MPRPSPLTGAEALAAAAAAMPASTIAAAYLIDRAGITLYPPLLLTVMAASGIAVFLWLKPRKAWPLRGALPFVLVVGAVFAWLMWIAAPSFLPLGSGSDLTHHLLLVQFIEQRWQLVNDPQLEIRLGEMALYTPGGHLLVALAGAWTGSSGLRALHGVVSACVALKVGFVFLIALRAIGSLPTPSREENEFARLPFALLSCVFLFASQVYFLRSFVENSFMAQVVSELFAIVMWWSLVAWSEGAGTAAAAVFGLAGAAAFLTWPVWIGPPALAAAILALLPDRRSIRERVLEWMVAAIPMAIVMALYFARRRGGLSMAATSGAAPWPLIANYGWPLLLLSFAGLILAAIRRTTRVTAIFAAAIGVQAIVLYAVATRSGASVPYLALKMLYLLLYPQAVAAALAVSAIWMLAGRALGDGAAAWLDDLVGSSLAWSRARRFAAWLLVAWVASVVGRPLAGAPRSLTVLRHAAVSAPLERAGGWARANNLPANCFEYLVDDSSTAYWLHLAVLGNPRISIRSVDPATFEPGLAIARWLTPGGFPYAIADLPALPRGVREELDIVQRFDTAAVVRRRGESSCAQTR